MKLSSMALLAAGIASPATTYAFAPISSSSSRGIAFISDRIISSPSLLFAAADDDDDEPQEQAPPNRSQLEGNQRAPTAQELSVMDDMITKLASAEPYELPNAVSKAIRVVSSPQFFMRIANRVDQETDAAMKAKLMALS